MDEANKKEDLIDHLQMLMGSVPPGTRSLLKVLAHPDMIEHTLRYFNELDTTHRCQLYDYPWNCAKEAEAKYENIKYGWTGGGIGFDESWCDPCRSRVLQGL